MFEQIRNFELVARELAHNPESQDNEALQEAICRKYGIFLNNITDDEAAMLSAMTQNIIDRGL